MVTKLDISLEPHLDDRLRPLVPLLPEPLASQLRPLLQDSLSSRTIPYELLSSISQWARSETGEFALQAHAPPLRPQDYAMISLLAGTRSSPDRSLPAPLKDRSDPQYLRRRELSDRRAITALVNALLSIGGAGAATWWAADRLAWKDEWVRIVPVSGYYEKNMLMLFL